MLKVILIDDEALALHHMEKLLSDIDGLHIMGKFQNPYQALEFSLRELPDVIFLDIEMPGLTGIEFAERIQDVSSEVEIVFVTAFNEYAVKAFEINAVDYIVKPVQRKRLVESVTRLKKKVPVKIERISSGSMVCCFHTLQFKRSKDDPENNEVHWRTAKARELFCYLIHHRQRPVRKDVILDLFWPELDDKKGNAQMYAAIYQIRKTLESYNMNITISSLDQSYLLELNEIKLDIDEWEKRVSELPQKIDEHFLEYQKVIELYRGDYLAEEGYFWAGSERERLRTLWLRHINKLTDYFISKEKYIDAILLYQRFQELHPFMDSSYFMLMKLYSLLGDHHAVDQQYNKLQKMLKEEFEVTPKNEIESWYEDWRTVKK